MYSVTRRCSSLPSAAAMAAGLPWVPAGSTTPIRLIGFQKVTLQPGESRRIRIEAEPKTLAHYDAQARQWKIEGGTYQVQLVVVGPTGKSAVASLLIAAVSLAGVHEATDTPSPITPQVH